MKDLFSKEAPDIRHLTGLIARLPDEPPPADFTQTVMGHITPKRVSFFRRLRIRLLCPLTAVAIRPLPAAAATAMLVGLLFAFKAFWISPAGYPSTETTGNPLAKTVNFILDWPSAEKVAVIGSFNHWQPEHYRMHRNQSDGTWQLTIDLQPGRHAYAFIVDDSQIISDPRALWEQDDGFGTRNSIITIENGNSDENRI